MYDFRRQKKKHFFNYDSEINGFIKSAVEKQAFVLIMAAENATL